MKTTIKLAAIFLALLITVACSPDKPASEPEPDPIDNNDDGNGDDNNGDDDGYVAGTGTGTYISEFVENDTFEVIYTYGNYFACPIDHPDYEEWSFIVLLTSFGAGYGGGGALGLFTLTLDGEKYISTNSNNIKYKSIIEELKDTTSPFDKNGLHEYPNGTLFSYDAAYDGMVSAINGIKDLVITSEPQYTTAIAEGEPINELFNLFYADMAGFVWKGYERPKNSYDLWMTFNPNRFPVQKKDWMSWLDLPAYYINVPAEDKDAYCNINYIGQDIILYPKVEPDDMEQEFVFKLKIEFTDGTVVTKTTEPTKIMKAPWGEG